jgi:hypothetical protein
VPRAYPLTDRPGTVFIPEQDEFDLLSGPAILGSTYCLYFTRFSQQKQSLFKNRANIDLVGAAHSIFIAFLAPKVRLTRPDSGA